MTDNKPAAPTPRPLWVRIILGGVKTRAQAWSYVWLCLLITLTCLFFGFWDPRLWCGAVLLVGVYGYWKALRWVDRHGRWE